MAKLLPTRLPLATQEVTPDVIFNTTKEILQVYNGNDFIDLTADSNEKGLKATGFLGFVSVKTSGNISVDIN